MLVGVGWSATFRFGNRRDNASDATHAPHASRQRNRRDDASDAMHAPHAPRQRNRRDETNGVMWDMCLSMVDGLCIVSVAKEEHRVHVTSVLTSLAQKHHSIKPSKMHILRQIIEYLGHMPTPDGTMPTSRHVDAIVNIPAPLGEDGLADKTMVRSLIGMIKYIRRYIPKCGLLCDPINCALMTPIAFGVQFTPWFWRG